MNNYQTENKMAVKFESIYTIKTNWNMSLTIKAFVVLGSAELTFKVQL